MNAKTAQKHDYPSAAHRDSYNRRSAAERTFATIKDPATNDHRPRLVPNHGPRHIALLTATVLIARNLRIDDAHRPPSRDERRATNGSRQGRKRHRQTADDLISRHKPAGLNPAAPAGQDNPSQQHQRRPRAEPARARRSHQPHADAAQQLPQPPRRRPTAAAACRRPKREHDRGVKREDLLKEGGT